MSDYYQFKNPYDFVPLEDAIDRGYNPQPQDRIAGDLYTGTIVCRLRTETPLFIHGIGQQQSNRRTFYRNNDGPIIPATSLKGAVRSIAEIVSNSCLPTLPDTLSYDLLELGLDGQGWSTKAASHLRGYRLERLRRKGKDISEEQFRQMHRAVQLRDRLGKRVRNVRTGQVREEPAAYRPCTRREELCFCCALFGMVEEELEEGATAAPLAGRVYFGVGRPVASECLPRWIHFPTPGGGPHPYHRPFYFEDDGTGKILGRKLYYHHRDWEETIDRNLKEARGTPLELEAYEGTFTFPLRFENLTERELGVLLYALELESGLRYHFGFGKPLALGTVHISVETLELVRFEEADGARGPARYLQYDVSKSGEDAVWEEVTLGESSRAESWKAAVKQDWENRPGGREACHKFRHILRWPTDETYQYPLFWWFREAPEAGTMGLEAYQAQVEAQSEPTVSRQPGEGEILRKAPAGRQRGTVKWFNGDKGYGFITRPGAKDVFVHFNSIRGTGYRTLNEGDRVEFEIEETPKGPQAVDVVVIN